MQESELNNIKKKLKNFTFLKFSNSFPYKIVILDDVDEINFNVQMNLRENLENNFTKINFWLSCNFIDKINPAIISRCMILNFRLIHPLDLCIRLKEIAEKEKFFFNLEFLENIISNANGDFRKVLNLLIQKKFFQKQKFFFNLLHKNHIIKSLIKELKETFLKDNRFVFIRKFLLLLKKKIKNLFIFPHELFIEIINCSIFFKKENIPLINKNKNKKKSFIFFYLLIKLEKISMYKNLAIRNFNI
jgi:DNA polymerase III delta prime subunit